MGVSGKGSWGGGGREAFGTEGVVTSLAYLGREGRREGGNKMKKKKMEGGDRKRRRG